MKQGIDCDGSWGPLPSASLDQGSVNQPVGIKYAHENDKNVYVLFEHPGGRHCPVYHRALYDS